MKMFILSHIVFAWNASVYPLIEQENSNMIFVDNTLLYWKLQLCLLWRIAALTFATQSRHKLLYTVTLLVTSRDFDSPRQL